jgi:hypothetical protein
MHPQDGLLRRQIDQAHFAVGSAYGNGRGGRGHRRSGNRELVERDLGWEAGQEQPRNDNK